MIIVLGIIAILILTSVIILQRFMKDMAVVEKDLALMITRSLSRAVGYLNLAICFVPPEGKILSSESLIETIALLGTNVPPPTVPSPNVNHPSLKLKL